MNVVIEYLRWNEVPEPGHRYGDVLRFSPTPIPGEQRFVVLYDGKEGNNERTAGAAHAMAAFARASHWNPHIVIEQRIGERVLARAEIHPDGSWELISP